MEDNREDRPSNYVTILDLRERWLKQQKEKENEEKMKKTKMNEVKNSDEPEYKDKPQFHQTHRFGNPNLKVDEENDNNKSVFVKNPNLNNRRRKYSHAHCVSGTNEYETVKLNNSKGEKGEVKVGVEIEGEINGVDQLKDDRTVRDEQRRLKKALKKKLKLEKEIEKIDRVVRDLSCEKGNSELRKVVPVTEKRVVAKDGLREVEESGNMQNSGNNFKEESVMEERMKRIPVAVKRNGVKGREFREEREDEANGGVVKLKEDEAVKDERRKGVIEAEVEQLRGNKIVKDERRKQYNNGSRRGKWGHERKNQRMYREVRNMFSEKRNLMVEKESLLMEKRIGTKDLEREEDRKCKDDSGVKSEEASVMGEGNAALNNLVLVTEKQYVPEYGECGEKGDNAGVKLVEELVLEKQIPVLEKQRKEGKEREGAEEGEEVNGADEMAQIEAKMKEVSVSQEENPVLQKQMRLRVKYNVAKNGECSENGEDLRGRKVEVDMKVEAASVRNGYRRVGFRTVENESRSRGYYGHVRGEQRMHPKGRRDEGLIWVKKNDDSGIRTVK